MHGGDMKHIKKKKTTINTYRWNDVLNIHVTLLYEGYHSAEKFVWVKGTITQ